MKLELIEDALMGLYCSLFANVCKLKENKKSDHQRYGDLSDKRYEISIQGYTALAEKVYDMMEEDDKDEDRPDKG